MRLERTGRTRSWLAVAAALLVVGLMAALLYSLGPARPGGHTTTRQIATPAKLTGHWQAVPYLAKELTPPIIAPSDPRIAYELAAPSANGVAHGMQRSDDGGATWHPLPTPALPGPLMDATIRVSPVDAHNVFLQVEFGVQMTGSVGPGVPTLTCPGPLARVAPTTQNNEMLSPLSNYGGCPALFYSTDGGDHWAASHLPLESILVYTNSSWPMLDMNIVQAQGSRLYAAMQPIPNGINPIGARLMASGDQGATWQLADASLFSQAPAICDLAVAPQGTTLFALTADSDCYDSSQMSRTVWRSEDDGAHWNNMGMLPSPAQELFVAGGGNDAPPLLYASAIDSSGAVTLSGVRVSANGGTTWQIAPTAGVPASMSLYQVAGVLPDGSLVAAMLPNTPAPPANAPGATPTFTQPRATYPFVLYAWKASDAAWHQLSASAPSIGQPGYMLVSPASGTVSPSVWVVTIDGDFQGGSGATFAADEYVLS